MTLKRKITADEALVWAEQLCGRAEYASGEIRERLIRKGLTVSEADSVVGSLAARRFVDDARFSRAFVRDKIVYARWGKKKVALALYQKRIPRHIIAEVLEGVDEDVYVDGLASLLRAKLRSLGAEVGDMDQETRAKLYRFAGSRGFESSAVSRALRIIAEENR